MRHRIPPALAASLAIALALPFPAHADGLMDAIALPYKAAGATLAQNMLQYARSTFWILAGIQFAGSSIRLGLQGADALEWSAHLVRQIIFVGFYAWIMENSYQFSLDIIHSFEQISSANAIAPSNIFSVGLVIAKTIYHNASLVHPIDAVVFGISSILIAVLFGWVAALAVVALCESYILVAAGVILTGFGGSEWTRDFANKSLLIAMSCGAKLFIMFTLISVGWTVMQGFATADYSDVFAVYRCIAAAFVYALIVMTLPNLASQFIQGAANGSTAAQGIRAVTQAAAGAALAATGVGAAAAGAMAAAGAGGPIGGLGGALNALGSGSGAGAAQLGGIGGSAAGSAGGGAGGPAGSPARQAGAALGQVGRAVAKAAAQEAYGRWSGTGIRGGTLGGRIHAYMMANNTPPRAAAGDGPPPPPPPAGGTLS